MVPGTVAMETDQTTVSFYGAYVIAVSVSSSGVSRAKNIFLSVSVIEAAVLMHKKGATDAQVCYDMTLFAL